jgi:hypothetical protein
MKNLKQCVQGIALLQIFAFSAAIFQFQLKFVRSYCVSLFVGTIGTMHIVFLQDEYRYATKLKIGTNIHYLFLLVFYMSADVPS